MPVSTLARVVIVLGVVLGIAGDALLNVPRWGLGAPIWVALAGVGLWAIVRASRLTLGLRFGLALAAWLGAAALFGGRDADGLKAFNLAVLAVLTAVLLCTVQPQFAAPIDWARRAAERLGAMLWRGFDVLETYARTRAPGSAEEKRRRMGIARGVLLALPLALVFGGLLASADAAFENLITRPFDWSLDAEASVSHLAGFFVAAWVSLGLLSAPGAGSLLRLIPTAPPVADVESGSPTSGRTRIGLTEVGFVLGTLVLLFGAFVAIQFRYFFSGDVQANAVAGLTYTEYARKGFFELVWATVLAVPVLLGCGKVALREGPNGFRLFAGLGTATVALLFVIMVSAWNRMALYVDAFGLTALRLYSCATMIWIGAVLAWMVAVYLRRRPTLFAPGAAALGVASVLILNAINPDGLIAKVNLERARVTGDLDVAYLNSLSLDAAPTIAAALPRARATHREALEESLAAMDRRLAQRDWRSWTLSEQVAERAIDRSRERWAVK